VLKWILFGSAARLALGKKPALAAKLFGNSF
jgi:hypothetical protein